MHLEQIVRHKKLFKSDWVMLLLVLAGLTLCCLLLAYMGQSLHMRTQVQQFVLFFALLATSYLIVSRQLTSFRYTLSTTEFTVYRRIGRQERLAERVPLLYVEFLSPYPCAPGKRGREHAVCIGKKQQSIVLAHRQKGKLQWLLISPNEDILYALNKNITAARLQKSE